MPFNKITDEMRNGKGNVGQPDTPGLTTSQMQEVMDELANLAIDGHNSHIDELEAATAATNIGATVPQDIIAQGNVQSILTSLATLGKTCDRDRHVHSNKTILDSITDTVKGDYDRVVQLLTGINAIQQAITNVETALPSSGAVVNYVTALDISEKAFDAAYPLGTVFMTTATVDPVTLFGYGTWRELGERDQYGISRYERIG